MIVDDEPNIRRVASLIIEPLNYNIITAKNGIEGFNLANEKKPDIIFSDILMPKCDGYDFCIKLKSNENTKDIPFIILTNTHNDTIQHRSHNAEIDDYLIKPFTSNSILEKIKKWGITNQLSQQTHLATIKSTQKNPNNVSFNINDIDQLLDFSIESSSFVFLKGPLGCGKRHLMYEFLIDGIMNQQPSLFVSFDRIHQKLINIPEPIKKEFLSIIDASQWTSINSKPWRSIHFIGDMIQDLCEKTPTTRIVIDSITHGASFWTINDILQLVDRCRQLPNHNNHVILWAFHSHHQMDALEFHLEQTMDISISMKQTSDGYLAKINFAKFQPFKGTESKVFIS